MKLRKRRHIVIFALDRKLAFILRTLIILEGAAKLSIFIYGESQEKSKLFIDSVITS